MKQVILKHRRPYLSPVTFGQMNVVIRPFDEFDWPEVLRIARNVACAGNSYTWEEDVSDGQLADYWKTNKGSPAIDSYVATSGENGIVGCYVVHPNRDGRGAHVAHCAYIVHEDHRGKGVGSSLCAHSISKATERGFAGIQFNMVVSTNVAAIHLWQKFGFRIIGTLPRVFNHKDHGLVDAHIMYLELTDPLPKQQQQKLP